MRKEPHGGGNQYHSDEENRAGLIHNGGNFFQAAILYADAWKLASRSSRVCEYDAD
jgi:hypothetical protein